MSDSDRDVRAKSNPRPLVLPGRLLGLIVPLVIVAVIGAFFLGAYWQSTAQKDLEQRMLARMLGKATESSTGESSYQDKDGDLVADSPADDRCISPALLRFSFIAADDNGEQATVWEDALDALGERLNRTIEYLQFSNVEDQIAALRNAELHIAALNTGIVPTAVRSCGFVPICTLGKEDGSYGYMMQIIVPSGSDIRTPKQLRGHKITFTNPISNSGFKAPLVLLLDEYQMQPERDYKWGFSLSHEESIRGIADGRYEAAPIASDVLERVIMRGDVPADAVRTIYESDRFPPWTIGYLYNLDSAIRKAVRESLMSFDWNGTGLETEFGADSRFVPVSYKDDWATTRQIDESITNARKKLVNLAPRRVSTPALVTATLPTKTPSSPIDEELPADNVVDTIREGQPVTDVSSATNSD